MMALIALSCLTAGVACGLWLFSPGASAWLTGDRKSVV